MTEVPEHLLHRSKARRAALAGGEAPAEPTAASSASASTEVATAASAAPAVAEAPKPAKVEPKLPWVEAGEARRKIPVWAMSVLAFLPVWAIFYMTTNDKPTPTTVGPVAEGTTVFAKCSSCHGASGEGVGSAPKLAGGDVIKTFAKPADQVRWVILGTEGFKAENAATYGDTKKKVGGSGGVMPGWGASLTPGELLAVVRHEREALSGEKFDATKWEDVTKLADDPNPLVSGPAKQFKAVLDEWKTLPAGS